MIINDSASLTLSQWMAIGQDGNAAGDVTHGGTVTLNGGTLTTGLALQVGERREGTLNVNAGVVDVGTNLQLARDHSTAATASTGIVNQNGGTVLVGGSIVFEQGGTGQATYNLTGGTLRANNIVMNTGDLNWAGGTLTMYEPNAASGGGAGTTINVTGDLATGAGAVLDLGDLYKSNGNNYDVMSVNGNLDLSGVGDVFDFWDNVNLIRPGGNTTVTGEIELINVTGTITDQFDTVIGPEALGQFFQFYQTGVGAVADGTAADDLRRNTGYLSYRTGDGIYFVYKVGGQIPEPQTTAFLFLGVVLLRGFSIIKRNEKNSPENATLTARPSPSSTLKHGGASPAFMDSASSLPQANGCKCIYLSFFCSHFHSGWVIKFPIPL